MSASRPAPPAAPRPRRLRKWLFRIAIGFVALVALLVFLTPVLVNTFVRPKVVAMLRERLNGEPEIDRLTFSWFSGLEIEGIRIGNPPGFSPGPCIQVDRVNADPSLFALLGGKLVLKQDARVPKPEVNVEVNDKNEINLLMLLKRPASAGGESGGGSGGAAGAVARAPAQSLPHVEAGLVVDAFTPRFKTPALSQAVALDPQRMEIHIPTFDRPIAFAVKSASASALDVSGEVLVARNGRLLDVAEMPLKLKYAIPKGYLAPLNAAVASVGPVKRFEGHLAAAGQLALEGLTRPSGRGEVTLDLAEVGVLLPSAQGAPVLRVLRPGAIRVSYDFQSRPDGKVDIDARFASPAASFSLKGVGTPGRQGLDVEGECAGEGDIAALAERFPGLLAAERKLQGRVRGEVKNIKATWTTLEADLDLRGEGIAQAGPGGAPVPWVKDAAARLHLTVDTEKGTYRLERMDVHADDLLQMTGFVRGEGLVVKAGEEMSAARLQELAKSASLDAEFRYVADLGALLAKARQFTDLIPAAMTLKGRAEGRFHVPPAKGGEGAAPFALQAKLDGFQATGVPGLDEEMIPREANATVEGRFDFAGDWSVALTKAEVASSFGSALADGTVQGLRAQPRVALTIRRAEGVPAPLSRALRKWLGGVALDGEPVSIAGKVAGGADGGSFDLTASARALDAKGLPGPVPAVVVRDGSVKLTGTGTGGWKKFDLAAFAVEAGIAPAPEKGGPAPAPSLVKCSGRAAADLAAGRYDAPELKVSVPGTTVSAKVGVTLPHSAAGAPGAPGSAPPAFDATVDLTGDTGPLLAFARAWKVPMTDLDGSGKATLHLEAAGTPARVEVRKFRSDMDVHVTQLADVAGHLAVDGLVADPGAPMSPAEVQKMLAAATLDMDLRVGAHVEGLVEQARKYIDNIPVTATGQTVSVVAKAGGGTDKGSFDLTVSAPALDVKGLPGPVPRVTIRNSSVKLAGTGAAGWKKFDVTSLDAAAELSSGEGAPAAVTLSGRAAADLAAARYELNGFRATIPGATLAGDAAATLPAVGATSVGPAASGAATVKIAVDATGSLKPLLPLARAWKVPVEDLGGEGEIVARVQADGPLPVPALRRLRAEWKGVTLTGAKVPAGIRWPASGAAEASADLAAGRCDVSEFKASLPATSLTASLSATFQPPPAGAIPPLESVTLKAAADASGQVKALLALARAVNAPLEGLEGDGDAAVHLEASGPLSRLDVKRLRCEAKGLALSGKIVPKEIRWPLSVAAEASLALSALEPFKAPIEIASGSVQGPGLDVKTLKGTMTLAAGAEKFSVEAAGTLDPTALAAAAPGYLQGVEVASGPGPFSLRAQGTPRVPEIATQVELPETTLRGAKLPKEGVALGKTSVELRARLDLDRQAYHVERAVLKSALASAEARGDIALSGGGAAPAPGATRPVAAGSFAVKTLDGRIEGGASLAKLLPLAVAFDALPAGTELAGNARVAADVKSDGKGCTFTADFAVPGLHVKGPQTKGVSIDEPQLQGSVAGAYRSAADGLAVSIAGATLKADLARLEGRGSVAMDGTGKLTALEGHAEASAGLAKLRALAAAFGAFPADLELAGDARLTADAKAGAGAYPFTADLAIPGLRFKGPQTKGVLVDEPEAGLKLVGTVVPAAKGFALSLAQGSELRLRLARGTVRGTIKGLPAEHLAENLTADLTYDPGRINAFLKAFEMGEIRAAGPQPVQVAWNGPILYGDDVIAWLGRFTLTGKLGFGSYAQTGVTVEGPPFPVDLQSGRMPLDYAFKVNGGATAVKGQLDTQRGPSRLALNGQAIAINKDMSPTLKWFSPILFVDQGALEGQADIDVDGTWSGPLAFGTAGAAAPGAPGAPAAPKVSIEDAVAKNLSGRGKIAVKNLRITGSPILVQLVDFLAKRGEGGLGEIQPSEFTVQNGVLNYQDMGVVLGGMRLVFAGQVKVDQTMNMQIVAPIARQLRDRYPAVEKYLGDTFVIPLGGTIASPRLDIAKAFELALKEAGERALKDKAQKVIENKAGDLFKGLLDRRKKK